MRLRRHWLSRVLALALIALAASPFTAPFSAHNACEAQCKDAASGDKIGGELALASVAPGAVSFGPSASVVMDRAAARVARHQPAPTVLRL